MINSVHYNSEKAFCHRFLAKKVSLEMINIEIGWIFMGHSLSELEGSVCSNLYGFSEKEFEHLSLAILSMFKEPNGKKVISFI